MDIKQLKTFICIAETGSLSAASNQLRIAQPALSRHIKLLEHEIGTNLFSRHARGMQLTETGEKFLIKVSGLIKQLEKSVDDIRSYNEEIKGEVAIGLLASLNSNITIRIVEQVKKKLPHVNLRLVESYSSRLVEWLQKGELDMSFLNGPAVNLSLTANELVYEKIVLISATGTLPDIGKIINMSDISHLPLAIPSRPNSLRVIIDKVAEKEKVSLNVKMLLDAASVLKPLIKSRNYHVIAPLSTVSEEIASGKLEFREFKSDNMIRHLVLATPPNYTTSVAAESVMEIIYKEILLMIEEGVWQAKPSKKITNKKK